MKTPPRILLLLFAIVSFIIIILLFRKQDSYTTKGTDLTKNFIIKTKVEDTFNYKYINENGKMVPEMAVTAPLIRQYMKCTPSTDPKEPNTSYCVYGK